jgi:membrane associated rhomboid family serine protease
MSGRYAFSLPEPRQRDGWFRIGSIDVTTTVLITGLGLASMFLYALNPVAAFKGAFDSELVRNGQIWRLATWPLVNPPSIWELIGLVVFWYFGTQVEEELGRKPYTVVIAAMTVIPALIVTVLNITNDSNTGRWAAYSFSVALLSLGLVAIFGIEHPEARWMFGIPFWVIAAAIVGIEILSNVGDRTWAQLTLLLLVIAVGCVGARQRGMLEQLTFIPRMKRLAGTRSPYGEIGSARPKGPRRFGKGKRSSGRPPSGVGNVVAGPWDSPLGPTRLEQAELDVLLDKISATGIDSLTAEEKARLNALSKRMRGS